MSSSEVLFEVFFNILRPLACVCLLLVVVSVVGGPIATVILAKKVLDHVDAPPAGQPSALEILKARYARGEITREQLEEMRKGLE